MSGSGTQHDAVGTTPLVHRPRLLRLLDGGGRLTILRGPPASGKRTLLDAWLRDRAQRPGADEEVVLRICIDRDHDAAGDFWNVLSDALAEAGVGQADDAPSSHQAVRRRLVSSGREVLLVVEHAERIASQDVDHDLIELLGHLPRLRVVVSTEQVRAVEVAGLVELGARLIDFPALCLTSEEVAELLGQCGVPDAEDRVPQALEDYGGWAGPTAALAMDMAAEADAGRPRVTPRYLAMILSRLEPPDFREFLLRISVVEELTVELAAALVDGPHAAEHVVRLAHSGLGECGDLDGVPTLRLPVTLREALRRELLVTRPEAVPALHARAAAWFHRHGHAVQAADHAHAAGDHDQVAAVIVDHWARLAVRHADRFGVWLRDVPDEVIARVPSIVAIRDIFVDYPFDAAGSKAVGDRASGVEHDGGLREMLGAGMLMIIATHQVRRPAHALRIVEEHDALVAAAGQEWLGLEADLRTILLVQWGIVRLLAGDLARAYEDFRSAYLSGRGTETAYIARNGATNAALVRALQGDLAGAEEWLGRAGQLPRAEGYLRELVEEWDPLVEALVASERGDVDAAETALRGYRSLGGSYPGWAVEAYVRAHVAVCGAAPTEALARLDGVLAEHPETDDRSGLATALLATATADLALRLGRPVKARTALDRAGDHPLLGAARARLALSTGDHAGALAAAATALATPESAWFRRVDLAAVQAIAERGRGSSDASARALRRAVTLAQRSGAVRGLALVPRREIVELAVESGLPPLPDPVLTSPEAMPAAELVALTERELLVLAGLARTAAHQEIASALFVSVNTVKTQVRSLYRKLGVSSREEALAVAYEHGFDLSDEPRRAR